MSTTRTRRRRCLDRLAAERASTEACRGRARASVRFSSRANTSYASVNPLPRARIDVPFHPPASGMPARPLAFRRGRPTITVQVVKTEKSKCQISIGCWCSRRWASSLCSSSSPASATSRTIASASSRSGGASAARSKSRPHRARAARPASSPTSCAAACTILLPLQYRVHTMPLVTIPQGKIGYVFARDGGRSRRPRRSPRTDARSDFQDVRAFLASGGQRGPQRRSCARAPTPSTSRSSSS